MLTLNLREKASAWGSGEKNSYTSLFFFCGASKSCLLFYIESSEGYKLYFVMPCRLIFLLNIANSLNKRSCTTYGFSILNWRCMGCIINQEGLRMLWSSCRFRDTTDTLRENHIKNAVHSLLFRIWLWRIDLLWRESDKTLSLPLLTKTLKVTAALQTSTDFGEWYRIHI